MPMADGTTGLWKKINRNFDVDQIKLIKYMIDNPELAIPAIEKALEEKDNVDFELFWSAYGYKVGKESCKKAWNKIKYSDQLRIIDVEIPRYHRFVELTGVYKMHASTYLNSKRYNDDIPKEEQWMGLIEKVLTYYDFRKFDWPSGKRPNPKSISRSAERFVYCNPKISSIQLCGIVEWKLKTTPKSHSYTITPQWLFSLERSKLATALMEADPYIRDLEVKIAKSKALKKLEAERQAISEEE